MNNSAAPNILPRSNPCLNAAFNELLRRIELNPTRARLASERYNAVKSILEKELPGKRIKLIGSFQRRTKIRPADLGDKLDIDVLVDFGSTYRMVVPPEKGISAAEALRLVSDALRTDKTYRMMRPDTDAPTVVLKYADEFSMEIVPAFTDRTGRYPCISGIPECHIIGTAAGNWVPAHYDYDALVISQMNSLSGGCMVPAVKLAKAFLRGIFPNLKSFHVEILCALSMPGLVSAWRLAGFRWGYQHLLASFLTKAQSLLLLPVSLPGSYSTPVDSGLSFDERRRIGADLNQWGQVARQLCDLGNHADALGLWRKFFGEPFPA